MRVPVFSHRAYETVFLETADIDGTIQWQPLTARLELCTVALAAGSRCISAFVNDDLSAPVLEALADLGVRGVALRCSGFNHVDLTAADRLGIRILRVPTYSPAAVAEHAIALMLSLNRKIHRAWQRVRDGNLSLDGLLGFDMRGNAVAVVGTGQIGERVARILIGFGCRVLAVDPQPDPGLQSLGVQYLPLHQALGEADIVTLHCPLTPQTRHLIDASALSAMKPGAMLVNTSRGGVVDTRALIAGLKSHRLGAVGLDVYEEEGGLFYRDLSDQGIDDDVFARLLTFPNVLVTAHQGFLTREALSAIARTTVANLHALGDGASMPDNEVGLMLLR